MGGHGQFPTGERVSPQRKVVIKNSLGEKLVGILHDTGSEELVIILHGFKSSKECLLVINIAIALQREGMSVFRFDSSGHGETKGSFRLDNYFREADDLRSVVEHFSKNQRTIAALVGHSKGGNVVLFHASKYNNVPMVVNLCGLLDLENRIAAWYGTGHLQQIRQNGFTEIKNRRGNVLYHVTRENLKATLTATRTATLSMNTNCRVLTVHGSADEVVPVTEALEFSKLIRNHELQLIEGADHVFSSHQNELVAIVVNFIKAGHINKKKFNKGKSVYQVALVNLKAQPIATQNAAFSMDTNCRVLTVHGSGDEVVTVADALEISIEAPQPVHQDRASAVPLQSTQPDDFITSGALSIWHPPG